jgi:hypothetical protein
MSTRHVHPIPLQMPLPPQQAALYREGRLDLATQAYKKGQFKSVQAAALAIDVRRTTLRARLTRIQPKLGSTAKNRLLIPTEEDSVVQWILSMDRRGMPPRLEVVRRMASLLASQHGQITSAGKCWARNFVNCHDELKSKYNRKYDYQRAKCEDPNLIEAIGAQRYAIPPLVIFEAVMHQASWYKDGLIPPNWSNGVSENGWTTNKIGLHWLHYGSKRIPDGALMHMAHSNAKFHDVPFGFEVAHRSFFQQ